MSDIKPFASLSSGLLARKGAAKPAMRPQGFQQFGASLEDLGWNDMGHGGASAPEEGSVVEMPEHVPSSIAALTPAPIHRPQAEEPDEAPEPVVVEQQRALAESFAETPRPAKQRRRARKVSKPAVVVALPRQELVAAKAKAAFTLRLDPERHLRLRLASALTRRSAQQIVTEALDEILKSIPGLDAMAERVPATAERG